jgi:hypothetical protein
MDEKEEKLLLEFLEWIENETMMTLAWYSYGNLQRVFVSDTQLVEAFKSERDGGPTLDIDLFATSK